MTFVPTALSLDFTSAILDGRISFSRSGATATRINSSGLIEVVAANTPRFDYTLNSGGTCKGLLIEGASSNISIYSQDATQWGYNGTSSASGTTQTSPDGTSSARAILNCEGVGNRFNSNGYLGITGGNPVTFSLYLKSNGNGNSVAIMLATAGGAYAQNINIVSITSEWARYDVSLTTDPTNVGVFWIVYGGTGTTSFVPWGIQVEQKSFATSYIPTDASIVTRNPDIASMTGGNFSSWWSAGLGAMVVSAVQNNISGVRPLTYLSDGTANEAISLRGNGPDPELYIIDNGSVQAQIDAGTITANTSYTLTGLWQTNNCAARLNNNTKVVDTTANIPSVSQMLIGSDGTSYLDGHLKSINYYDSAFYTIYNRRKNKVVFSVI